MTNPPEQTSSHPPARRGWLGWLPLLILGLLLVVGYRLWTDHLEASPITQAHAGFIEFMAQHSPRAREYRDRYYAKFGRQSIASKHFEQVCAAMLRSAVDDNVDPARHSAPMAQGCRSRGRKYLGVELPN